MAKSFGQISLKLFFLQICLEAFVDTLQEPIVLCLLYFEISLQRIEPCHKLKRAFFFFSNKGYLLLFQLLQLVLKHLSLLLALLKRNDILEEKLSDQKFVVTDAANFATRLFTFVV
jgi:flagellar biosynthesis protein FlhB